MKLISRMMTCSIGMFLSFVISAQTTYYSFATGNWEDNTSWSLTSDGSSGAVGAGIFPGRADNVVIRSSHTITVDDTGDNGSTGVSPDALGQANVAPFVGSGNVTFYQTGDIIVANGGTFSASVRVMLSGVTYVENGGTFDTTGDLFFLGALTVETTATFDVGDDFVLTGNSVAVINNTSTANDDLYIDFTDAQLCGTGAATLGSVVEYYNGGSAAQICSSFTLNCGGTCAGTQGSFITGSAGPGGVGNTGATSNLSLWLDANEITGVSDGADLTQWDDLSGNGYNALDGLNAPSYASTGGGNGFPTVNFDNSNNEYMFVTGNAEVMPTDELTVLMVGRFQNTSDNRSAIIATNDDDNRDDGWGIMQDETATNDVGFFVNNWNSNKGKRAINYGTNHVWGITYSTAQGRGHKSENNVSIPTSGSINYNGGANDDLLLGAASNNSGPNYFIDGNISEVIIYDVALNDAQRIIATNFLAAKYDISLSASDEYTMDNNGNGDYDFEVAGVGQAADGSNHKDAKGAGIVRVWNLSDLDNSEFLFWGHDNVDLLTTQTSDVDGVTVEERLSRIWRVSETGDVGTVSISLDFSSLTANPLGSNLRLLIDRDGDGFADNDVTPVAGAESNDLVTFSNINFQDGDRFTLGNVDATIPLPVELIEFNAQPAPTAIELHWKTATEQDNDYFLVQKSVDAISWDPIANVKGAGNSSTVIAYSAIDRRPTPGSSYYRLKQVDFDGTTAYSEVQQVDWSPVTKRIYATPNPSNDFFYIPLEEPGKEHVQLFDNSGKALTSRIELVPSGIKIDLSDSPKGIYLLKDPENKYPTVKLLKK